MPCPPLYLRNVYSVKEQLVVHEVIDGQQRLRAVLDFMDGSYAITKSLEASYAGKRFDELTTKQQIAIRKYTFHCETFHEISDQEVFEVFRRMNTFSSPLTKQELRHGRYFGPFSQSCESLALEFLEFWRQNKILSEQKIARMGEVQFTSALLISQLSGMQDKNDSIETFYGDYDITFPNRAKHEKAFRATMAEVINTFPDGLNETHFRKPPFFYTLFGAVYHRLYGMPNQADKSPRKKLSMGDRNSLANAVDVLSNVITVARSQQKLSDNPKKRKPSYPARFGRFAAACLSQTDNVAPRTTRFETLYREAFG
jgi:hypothetical protein